MSCRFLYGNAVTGITPVASASDTGYSVLDAIDGIPGSQFQYTGVALTVKWDAGVGNVFTAQAASIHNHSLLANATVTVEWSDDDFSTVSATDTLIVNPGYDSHIKFAAERSDRYVRFNIVPAASHVMKIGELNIWTTCADLTALQNWEYEDNMVYFGQEDGSWGQYFRNLDTEAREYVMAFDAVGSTDTTYLDTLAKKNPIVFVPNSAYVGCHHGAIPGFGIRKVITYAGARIAVVIFRENAKGIIT